MSRWLMLACVIALAALLIWWYAISLQIPSLPRAWLLTLLVGPLLIAATLLLLNRPSAPFWTGFITLLHFCHGTMEAWTEATQRLPALLEVALVLLIYAILLRDGLRARRLRRAAAESPPQR